MEYRRANYAHNFLNAIDTDHLAAWDMFVNELNELLVNNKAAVTKAIRDSGLRVHANDSLKVMSDLIHDKLYTTPALRTNLNKLILARHKSQDISAEGGTHDKLYSNAAGDVSATDASNSTQVSAINEATEKLVGVKENENGLSVPKDTVKALADENLKNKMDYAGVSDGLKIFSRRNITIGLIVLAVGVTVWGIYKITKKN